MQERGGGLIFAPCSRDIWRWQVNVAVCSSAPPLWKCRLLLVTAAPGELNVLIPATITFTPGGHYQLWLVALNSRGHSDPGPVQNWTAV